MVIPKTALRKNGQMKIKEMIFMILALVLFFSIVLLFVLSVSLNGLKKDVTQLSRNQAIALVVRLADSPEFSCGGNNFNCVDTDKLIALTTSQAYRNFWQVDGLVIEKVSEANLTNQCTLSNYPRCGVYVLKSPPNSTIPDATTVSLCRKENKNNHLFDLCEIGQIKVWTKK